MPRLARFSCVLWVTVLAVAWAGCASAADYPDYAPPPSNGEPGRAWRRGLHRRRPNCRASWRPKLLSPEPRPLPRHLQPANYQAAAEPEPERQAAPQPLAERQRAIPLTPPRTGEPRPAGNADRYSQIATTAASLGIVLGLFILVVWVVRRSVPKGTAVLPREAVEVLGRTTLAGRQSVHLVRCGNKMLLLSISPTSVQTLTEITDAAEVEHLAAICQTANPQGVTASFRQVFNQFANQPRGASITIRGRATNSTSAISKTRRNIRQGSCGRKMSGRARQLDWRCARLACVAAGRSVAAGAGGLVVRRCCRAGGRAVEHEWSGADRIAVWIGWAGTMDEP